MSRNFIILIILTRVFQLNADTDYDYDNEDGYQIISESLFNYFQN